MYYRNKDNIVKYSVVDIRKLEQALGIVGGVAV
jgi:hypothetical protein